jgi:hypothetical protein
MLADQVNGLSSVQKGLGANLSTTQDVNMNGRQQERGVEKHRVFQGLWGPVYFYRTVTMGLV